MLLLLLLIWLLVFCHVEASAMSHSLGALTYSTHSLTSIILWWTVTAYVYNTVRKACNPTHSATAAPLQTKPLMRHW